ncbi:MAG: hypothetical protein R2744_13555 [Bacteroidales bacterium]
MVTSIHSSLTLPAWKPGATVETEARQIINTASLKSRRLERVYATAVRVFALEMTDAEAATLRCKEGCSRVWPDRMFILRKPGTRSRTSPAETVPYGIARVGYANYTGSHKAWIIDTGIDLKPSDLNVDVANSTTLTHLFG